MSEIVQFPGPIPPPEGYSEQCIDKLHSAAFRSLETSLRDCVRMAGIAAQVMFDASVDDEQLRFVVFHSAEMLTALGKKYDARWHGELRGPA